LHDWALGVDPSPVRSSVAQPSLAQSLTLDPDEVDDRFVLGRLYGLLERLCTALRQQRRVCRHLVLTIRHSDHVEEAAQQTLPHSTCWEADLEPVLTRLFFRCFRRRVRLTHLTLSVTQLEPPAEQLSLFDELEPAAPPRSHRLSLALDAIRAKFGERAVSWGKTRP
jgi:DNA polymerase-4